MTLVKIVSKALAKDVCCKKSMIEYICKVCHHALCMKVGTFLKMPANAVAKKGSICKSCQLNTNRTHVIEDKWEQIWKTMQGIKNFNTLSRYVKAMPKPEPIEHLLGNRHLQNYTRDALAHFLVPDDSPVCKEEAFLVMTTENGNCFVNSLSQIVYSHGNHYVELRFELLLKLLEIWSFMSIMIICVEDMIILTGKVITWEVFTVHTGMSILKAWISVEKI